MHLVAGGNFGVSSVFWSVLRWSLRSWQQLHRLIQTDKLSESLKQLFQYPPDNLINVIAPFFLSDYTYSSSCVSPVPFSLVIVSYASGRVPLLLPSVSCHRGSDEHSVPAVNGPSSAAAERLPVTGGGGLFVLASLVIESWARTFKEELAAKTEQLREQFPFRLMPNRVCAPVILLHQMCKPLEGSEKMCWFLPARIFLWVLSLPLAYIVPHWNSVRACLASAGRPCTFFLLHRWVVSEEHDVELNWSVRF